MKVHLMHPEQDFDAQQGLPPHGDDLVQDLALDVLLGAMAQEDPFLLDVAQRALLCGVDDLQTIGYRQEVLKDCLRHPDVVRQLYSLPVQAVENKRRQWLGTFGWSPGSILGSARLMLEMLVGLLRE
ncbi:MAG: DNA mismatch repair protein MutS, partial [Chloroflexi bacterium]|nr:DNA mismatch repair protein MutS [Chloroflexota bacterium]